MNYLEPFEILKHLDKLNIVKETTTEYHCTCPVCNDGGFKIEKETGLFNAFKCGCEIPRIREAIKPLAQAFEEVLPPRPVNPQGVKNYKYTTWSGEPRAIVKRIDRGDGKKDFKQGHWTGETYESGLPIDLREDLAIYRWPEIKQAMQDGEAYIFWVEGEKSADALWELGLPATTSIGGSGGYDSYGVYSGAITGSRVVVCPDMAPDGIKYAKMVQQDYPDCLWLHAFPNAPQWGNISKGKGHDIANWIAAGATVEDILLAIENKPREYEPKVQNEAAKALHQDVLKYSTLKNAFERAVEAQKIKKKYGISSSELKDLIVVAKEDDSSELVSMEESLAVSFKQLERQSMGEIPPGIDTGFRDLDAVLMGLERKSLIILAGRPSSGKTALCLSIAGNVAINKKVCIFSMEQAKEKLINRMIASKTRILSSRLRRANLSLEEWDILSSVYGEMASLNIRFNDAKGLTVDGISSIIDKSNQQPDLIMIDYLQLIHGTGENETVKISNISRALTELAYKHNAPVFALSQLSRSTEGRTDKRPMMSDLRSSGSIEQDADQIMLLYRDEYYNPNTPDKGIAEVNVAKNRDGSTEVVKLLFEPEYTRFSSLGKRGLGY